MKNLLFTSIILLFFNFSYGQLSFSTGSVELDKNLSIVNANAKLDLNTFKIDLSVSHNIPIPKIDELLKIMAPAEIILAKDIADIVGKSLDNVVSSYRVNKDKGWGYIAKQMGIKPGSPEFHALKGKSKSKAGKAKNKGKGNGKSKGKSKGKGEHK